MGEEACTFAPGEGIEAYWPDDDTWLPATLQAVNDDGTLTIEWEDGAISEALPADYARRPGEGDEAAAAEAEGADEGAEEAAQAGEEEASATGAAQAGGGGDVNMDALMAAAMAAGACDEADQYTAGALPPSKQHWVDLNGLASKKTTDKPGEEAKRCRPTGLMTSEKAREMALAAKKAKTA
eukprot:TRINITY_DN23303_c0_g1_i1.p1 TRINITY_DN23303_c0_g1~~TRINITY_DN23303_c0_g1_i1.p1  ORF type:complete len:182 (+),score=59.98 TRINITY_DN23303_c0_g1_i1:60-605(+)